MEESPSPSAAVAEVDALLGRTIAGKFLIDAYLGGGAMGAVYRARQVSLDKVIAIKVLRPQLAKDESFVARFHREARAASRLDHPGVIRILDYGQEPDGLFYIAMEFLDGRSLSQVLASEFPLAPERIVAILSQILGALAAAHEAGVLHRDLKPENVMLTSGRDDEGHVVDLVKVLDFGVAKIATPTPESPSGSAGEHPTLQGLILGTPEYMSPEQGRGEPIDERSDVYAVGVVLYQMLCNHLPFEAETPLGVIMRHIVEAPTPPSAHFPYASGHLEEVCMRAMRKDRAQRFLSAREMRADLRARFRDLLFVDVASVPLMPSERVGPRRLEVLDASEVPPPVDIAEPADGTLTNDVHHPRPTWPHAGSVLPAPRRRSPFWRVAAAAVLVSSVISAAAIASGRPLARVLPELWPLAGVLPPREPRALVATRVPRVHLSANNLILAPSAASGLAITPPAANRPPRIAARRWPVHRWTAARPALPPPNLDGAPSAGGRVSLGAVAVTGLDEPAVRRLVTSGLPRVTRCYDDALRAGATHAQGTASLTLETSDGGTVTRVEVGGLELPPLTEHCIVDAYHGATVALAAPGPGKATAVLELATAPRP